MLRLIIAGQHGEDVSGACPRSRRLLERFRIVQDFTGDDQEALIRIIDAMIAQHRTRSAMAPVDRPKKPPKSGSPE